MRTDSRDMLQEPTRVKWITDVGQQGDDPQQMLLTRHHEVIRRWAQQRRAEPGTYKGKFDVNDGGSELRFDFPGMGRLEPMSWDDWLHTFEAHKLVFAYREHTPEGQLSHEYHVVDAARLRAAGIECRAGDLG